MDNTFLQALQNQKPLQIAGTINAYTALLAQQAGFKAIYLSGAGVANACFALPDLGVTSLDDVATEVARICQATALPLLVDADTGWDDIALTVTTLESAGATAIHIEDQVEAKRCGHLQGKQLVSVEEMQQRIKQADAAKKNLLIMARTDAHAIEGLDSAIHRAQCYVAAGAQLIFAEALNSIEDMKTFCQAIQVPVLINLTEFGKTPLYSIEQIRQVGATMALYPLSAFRAMNAAAKHCYEAIIQQGSQVSMVDKMQSRDELYEYLNYYYWEANRDELLKRLKNN